MRHYRPILSVLALLFQWWVFIPAQTLEIHHIGVGRGDCTFIIAQEPNDFGQTVTRTVLIDCGEGKQGEKAVFPYVKDQLVRINYPRIDFVITSHIHNDHQGGTAGFFDAVDNFNKKNPTPITIGGIYDGTCEMYSFYPNSPRTLTEEECYDNNLEDPIVETTESYGQFYNRYKKIVTKKTAGSGTGFGGANTAYSNIPLKANLFSELQSMSMTCLTANGMVANTPSNQQIAQSGKCKENDLSFSFLIQFNSFQYFTGGDLGGAVHGGSGTNMETPLVTGAYFKNLIAPQNHVCAFKVSHHGSAGSTNDNFITTLNPTLAIIMGNYRKYNGTPLPTLPNILNQLAKAGLGTDSDEIMLTSSTAGTDTPTPWSVGNSSGDVNYLQNVVLTITTQDNPPPGSGEEIWYKYSLSTKEKNGNYTILKTTNEVIQCYRAH